MLAWVFAQILFHLGLEDIKFAALGVLGVLCLQKKGSGLLTGSPSKKKGPNLDSPNVQVEFTKMVKDPSGMPPEMADIYNVFKGFNVSALSIPT